MHVNESSVEWPPSPWRILRALVAVWRRTLPGIGRDQVEPILRCLAEPPEFLLPPASSGHTRHFMPKFKIEKGANVRTLIFDTFVIVGRDSPMNGQGLRPIPLFVRWPNAMLEKGGRETLERLLANLNSLGRSESWCAAELLDDSSHSDEFSCSPLQDEVPCNKEIVRLLCPDPARAFEDCSIVNVKTKSTGKGKGKQILREHSGIYDPPWNLCIETPQLQSEKWSDPPGSRWIKYVRPRDCFKINYTHRPIHSISNQPIQVMRFVLDSNVLPLVTETLPVAEATRRALMGIQGRLTEKEGIRGRSNVLSGKDVDGQPLTGHRHAYYLPTDEDGDGRLDHITVYSIEGFDHNEQSAFDLLREISSGREGEARHPLCLLLLGKGALAKYSPGPLQSSKVWISSTPYIATRFAKTRGRSRVDITSPKERADFLREDIKTQLAAVWPDITGIRAEEVTIEPLWDENQVFRIRSNDGTVNWRIIQFKRYRCKESDDGGRRLAGAFRLTFSFPVQGPIAIGHGAHFGMGLFKPILT